MFFEYRNVENVAITGLGQELVIPECLNHNNMVPHYCTVDNYHSWEDNTTIRILLMGDSVVQERCPYEKYLEDLLHDKYPNNRFNVVNIGLGGRTIRDSKAILNEFITQFKTPHFTMISTTWNDHWYSTNVCDELNCYPRSREFYQKAARNAAEQKLRESILRREQNECFELVKSNAAEISSKINHSDTSIYRVPIPEFKQLHLEIDEIANTHNITMFFFTPPNGLIENFVPEISYRDCTLIDKNSYLDVHNMYTNTIRDVTQITDSYLVDLQNIFYQREDRLSLFDDYKYDPIHPNSAGNKVCTESFFEVLIETDSFKKLVAKMQ